MTLHCIIHLCHSTKKYKALLLATRLPHALSCDIVQLYKFFSRQQASMYIVDICFNHGLTFGFCYVNANLCDLHTALNLMEATPSHPLKDVVVKGHQLPSVAHVWPAEPVSFHLKFVLAYLNASELELLQS